MSNNSITEGTQLLRAKLAILGDSSHRGFNHFFLQLPHASCQTAHSRQWEEEAVDSDGKCLRK